MDRAELAELHYIAPIVNLASVLEHGILSHERARRVEHSSVAMAEMQTRRARVTVPGARRLHEYVNLYVNARNPMLYKRLDAVGEICVLHIDTAVLDLPGVVVADQNAGSDYVRFAPAADGLKLIERDVVFAQYWTHGDAIQQWRHWSYPVLVALAQT